MGLGWVCSGFAMLWVRNGFFAVQWVCDGFAMQCNGFAMGLQWLCNVMGLQWLLCSAMGL